MSKAESNLITVCKNSVINDVFSKTSLGGSFNKELAQNFLNFPNHAYFTTSQVKTDTVYSQVTHKLNQLVARKIIFRLETVENSINRYVFPYDEQLSLVEEGLNKAKEVCSK